MIGDAVRINHKSVTEASRRVLDAPRCSVTGWGSTFRVANSLHHRLKEGPCHFGVLGCERAKLPLRHDEAPYLRHSRHSCRTTRAVDERHLSEVVSRAQPPNFLAVDLDSSLTFGNDKEGNARFVVRRQLRAGRVHHVMPDLRKSSQVASGQLRKQSYAA